MKLGEDCTGISVVFLCHDGMGNYLLCKRGQNCRDEQGTWDPGAGALDLHEDVEDAMRREIGQEYCTKVLSYEPLGFRDVHRLHEGRKTHWIALDFRVLVDRSAVRNGEPHKFDEIGWFTLDNFPEPLHSQFPFFLAKYKGRI